MKINITSFMGNEVLNIFSYNNFFEESNTLLKNSEKKNFGGIDISIFLKGHLNPTTKINRTPFITNEIRC